MYKKHTSSMSRKPGFALPMTPESRCKVHTASAARNSASRSPHYDFGGCSQWSISEPMVDFGAGKIEAFTVSLGILGFGTLAVKLPSSG